MGTDGPDHLFGGDGDDYLAGGEGADVLTGGAGRDELIAGGGRDVVVVLDACELARGEILDGGPGDDVLYAPMGADELRARGVTVEGFERVVTFDASALGCDPTTCRCAAPFIPGTSAGADPCDMRALTAEGIDTRELRAACEDFLANATSMVFDLPDSPTAADMEAMIALDPRRGAAGETLRPLAGPGCDPTDPEWLSGDPAAGAGPVQTGVLLGRDPCDRPDLPMQVVVGWGGLYFANCTDAEEAAVRDALDTSAFVAWRAQQRIQEVLDEEDDVAAADLWSQGVDGLSLEFWFGPFSRASAERVGQTVDLWLESLHQDNAAPYHVQCHHRFGSLSTSQQFQAVLLLLFNPASYMWHFWANPCAALDPPRAHTEFVPGFNAVETFYPINSVEVCEGFFDMSTEHSRLAQAVLLLHEFLHWRNNGDGLADFHSGSQAWCDTTDCSCENAAALLGQNAPDIALQNIDNYRFWADTMARGYFDHTDGPGESSFCSNALLARCFPSECCGNGVLDPETGEICDRTDFGRATCLSEAGLTQGALVCSADCSTIDSGRCFGSCGNGAVDPALGEQCDFDPTCGTACGVDFGGESCASYGHTMGDLICAPGCLIDTSGCSGGTGAVPETYADCGVGPGVCDGAPEDCHTWGDAGNCLGGPCIRTDPGAFYEGQIDPDSAYHPR